MIDELLYARYHPSDTRVHACTRAVAVGRNLVYDLAGEVRSPILRDRLLALDVGGRFSNVLLRGCSEFLLAELETETGHQELAARFPQARIWLIDIAPQPTLVAADSGPQLDAATAMQLLEECIQAELEAALFWNNAIWHNSEYHFVVPSGQHADKFIRIGDIFVDPLNVARIADWCAHLAPPPTVLVADSFTLLPLLQEIELRWLRQPAVSAVRHEGSLASQVTAEPAAFPARWSSPKYILPLYGAPRDEIRERLAEVVPIARENGAAILCLVSVSASGGYVAAMRDGLASFAEPPTLRVLALCSTVANGGVSALCRVPVRSFPDSATCDLCLKDTTTAIEIDQQRLTTRLGIRVLSMPKPKAIEDSTQVIRDADPHQAFRVHVDRADRHGHLAIYMDTQRLLRSRVARAKATLGLARLFTGFTPDLVLVPHHDATGTLQDWLHEEGVSSPTAVAVDEGLTSSIRDAIAGARAILLVDDAVISGRTMHALIEIVQRIKAEHQDSAFELRGFALVARPPASTTWKRLRDRFHIRGQMSGLQAAWEVNLPDVGANRREACPWCVEQRMLNNVIPRLPPAARPYIERRLERLSNPAGLDRAIYLGAEKSLDDSPHDGWDPAIHTTPGSYLGDVGDVGAFVGAVALLQSMRDEWNQNVERWSMRYALPIGTALGRYTDPVIVAGILRGVSASEVRAGETENELARALDSLDHQALNPILAAELLLAGHQRKLPLGAHADSFRARLAELPEAIRVGLEALLFST